MNTFTNIAPLIFYVAGGVWSLVGLMSFSYMHGLRDDADLEPAPILVPVRASAE
jgi:hypothetical protein